MSHYKPYPAYKDSGVEWLGWVPSHWVVTKVGRTFAGPPCYGVLVPDFEADGVPMLRITDMEHEHIDKSGLVTISHELSAQYSRTIVQKGDVVLSVVGTIGKAFKVSEQLAGCNLSRAVARVQPSDRISAAYLCKIFDSAAFTRFVDLTCLGSAQRVLNMGDLSGFHFCVPALNEQLLICAHLDRETARIDGLIGKKTRFIELLREKRQALITHAVTKGLDPSVKMKDSGVEWLGEVPEHWDVAPMKYVCELLKDGTHLPPPRTDEGVPLLSVRNIIDGHFTLRDDDSTISHQDYMELCKAFVPQEGDVLLAVVGATLGKTALIPAALGQFHIQRSLAIFRPHHGRMNSCWLHLIFQSSLFQSLLWEHAGYSAQPGIYLGTLGGFSIPQPPLNEQAQIFSYLSERTARLDSLIRTTESSIELLKERRSALITAAVTGQIDLREAV